MNSHPIAFRLAVVLAMLSGLAACADHGHDHAKEAGHAHSAAGGHGPAGEKITHFTERTELFVEFPRLTFNLK